MNRKLLQYFDFPLLGCALALNLVGCLAISSATHHRYGDVFLHKQVLWIGIGLAAFVLLSSFNYQHFERFATWVYVFNLVLLAAVFAMGSRIRGAQRWLDLGGFMLQPSEFSKLFLSLTLAALLARHHSEIRDARTVLRGFFHLALPAALVFKQPHLGNTVLLVVVLFGMLFMSGARISHLSLAAALGVTSFLGAWHTGRIKDEQKRRLTVFVSAGPADVRDESWQPYQSKVAIGAGGFTGHGYMQGSQNQLGFVPDNQNDFVFAVIGEDFGFMGSSLVLCLFGVMLWRILFIIRETEVLYGALVASGLFFWLLLQVLVNLGMTMHSMPVAGLPLPLVSYGGSCTISSYMTLGLLQSIALRRKKMVF